MIRPRVARGSPACVNGVIGQQQSGPWIFLQLLERNSSILRTIAVPLRLGIDHSRSAEFLDASRNGQRVQLLNKTVRREEAPVFFRTREHVQGSRIGINDRSRGDAYFRRDERTIHI